MFVRIAVMKTKSRSERTSNGSKESVGGNKKYVIGSHWTPVGPAGVAVWLTEVEEIDTSQRHMIGVKRCNDSTIWVHDSDKGAQELIKDRERMLAEVKRSNAMYTEYLREKKYNKR